LELTIAGASGIVAGVSDAIKVVAVGGTVTIVVDTVLALALVGTTCADATSVLAEFVSREVTQLALAGGILAVCTTVAVVVVRVAAGGFEPLGGDAVLACRCSVAACVVAVSRAIAVVVDQIGARTLAFVGDRARRKTPALALAFATAPVTFAAAVGHVAAIWVCTVDETIAVVVDTIAAKAVFDDKRERALACRVDAELVGRRAEREVTIGIGAIFKTIAIVVELVQAVAFGGRTAGAAAPRRLAQLSRGCASKIVTSVIQAIGYAITVVIDAIATVAFHGLAAGTLATGIDALFTVVAALCCETLAGGILTVAPTVAVVVEAIATALFVGFPVRTNTRLSTALLTLMVALLAITVGIVTVG